MTRASFTGLRGRCGSWLSERGSRGGWECHRLAGVAPAGEKQQEHADGGGDGDDAKRGAGAVEVAVLPGGVGDAEVVGEAGDGDGGEVVVGAGVGGERAEDA